MKTPQKPLVLFVALPANMGGSNKSLVTLMRGLHPWIHSVLAAPARGGISKTARTSSYIDEHLPIRHGTRWNRIHAAVSLAWWAGRHRRSLSAIHAQALTGLNVACLAAFVTQVPIVVRVSDPVGSRFGRWSGPIIRLMLPRLICAPVSQAAAEVAVANRVCRRRDCVVISNPVDAGDVVATERVEYQRVRIAYLGGLSYRKGFDLLPGAVDGVGDLPVTWKLFMNRRQATDVDNSLLELERYDHELVEFHDRAADVRTAYGSSDIVFVPSRAESFCRVAAEAMLNGLPVVASDIPALRELVGDDEAGLLFPPGDHESAAAAIRRLVNDPDLRRRLGQTGTQKAAGFRPDAIAKQMLPLYGLGRLPSGSSSR